MRLHYDADTASLYMRVVATQQLYSVFKVI